jgi:hypothetical protein
MLYGQSVRFLGLRRSMKGDSMPLEPKVLVHPRVCVRADRQDAELGWGGRAGVHAWGTSAAGRRRSWFAEGDALGVQPMVILAAPSSASEWTVTRASRDQTEWSQTVADGRGRELLVARQTVTVDEWGLHLALAIDNVAPHRLESRWGFGLNLAAPLNATLAVPSGAIGDGVELKTGTSPFVWPRCCTLQHANADRLDVLAYPPLTRTEVRRGSDQIELILLALGPIASGQTVRAECRLRSQVNE